MVTYWMGVAPRDNRCTKKALRIMLDKFDCKTWIIAMETGKDGYRHWQIRLGTSSDDLFDWAKAHIPVLHLEKAETDDFKYERKEGHFWSSKDTIEIRKTRFGTPRKEQEAVINALRTQSDREVYLWYDPKGNAGKSWLCNHLFETGKAHYVPPYLSSVQSIVQTCASLYNQEWRDIVIIDIPRSMKWSTDLAVAIEAIKDGLIMDPRYSAQPINIRGVKVLVLTNHKVKFDELSVDRWVVNGSKLNTPGLS